MQKKEIDDFLNLNEKEFKTNKYGSGKLLPFLEDIKYMKEKKIPNKIIIKYLKEKKDIVVSETNFSLFLLRNGLRNSQQEKEKITKIKKTTKAVNGVVGKKNAEVLTSSKEDAAKEAAKNFFNKKWE